MKKKNFAFLVLPFFLTLLFAIELTAKEPVKIIFDTDIGNDIDDTMALAVAHALQNRGELEILAVTTTKDHPYAGPMVSLVNTFYGRADIPIGLVKNGVTPEEGRYNKNVAEARDENGQLKFPRKVNPDTPLPEAVALLRKTLASQPDGSVVIVQIGFFTNLARLLDTPGDEFSPLNGKELVMKKVKYVSLMAGAFEGAEKKYHLDTAEYNVGCDLPSARKMIAEWPTEMVFSGFEIGMEIMHPSASMRQDFEYIAHHPVKEGYAFYRGLDKDQPTFDLNSVLYAARPDRGYYSLSEPGTVSFDEKGISSFKADPAGKHRFQIVTPLQKAMVREALVQLTSEPPKKL